MRHRDRLADLVAVVQYGESRTSLKVNRVLLGLAKSASDVALSERPAGACGEHEVLRPGELRALLVSAENRCQLTWDRDGSHGAVCLGGPEIAMAIDLGCELHLCVLHVRDADVGPPERQELRDASAGQRG